MLGKDMTDLPVSRPEETELMEHAGGLLAEDPAAIGDVAIAGFAEDVVMDEVHEPEVATEPEVIKFEFEPDPKTADYQPTPYDGQEEDFVFELRPIEDVRNYILGRNGRVSISELIQVLYGVRSLEHDDFMEVSYQIKELCRDSIIKKVSNGVFAPDDFQLPVRPKKESPQPGQRPHERASEHRTPTPPPKANLDDLLKDFNFGVSDGKPKQRGRKGRNSNRSR
jgi:hypothetical protein